VSELAWGRKEEGIAFVSGFLSPKRGSIELRETAIDQIFVRNDTITRLDLFDHHRHSATSLPTVIASTPTITWVLASVANWTLSADRNPPSPVFIIVASGSVEEYRVRAF